MFGYEYFSGANVLVEIDGVAALECAGISYSISESKTPIYGYSDRFFSGVARGHVLVQGNFVVNYVHENYVSEIIRANSSTSSVLLANPNTNTQQQVVPGQIKDSNGRALENQELLKKLAEDYQSQQAVAEQLRSLYWGNENVTPTGIRSNPHDLFGGINIKIHFGEYKMENNMAITGTILKDVYIVGRGKQIRISEDTIVEEFSFFARNASPILPRNRPVQFQGYGDDQNDSRNINPSTNTPNASTPVGLVPPNANRGLT